jgi:hypothetical protein
MTQPSYVPMTAADTVRAAERMPVPDGWRPERPGEITSGSQPKGGAFGNAGPDQGYALKLARLFVPKLNLQPGERVDDAVAGALAVALKRASLFGRAPVVYDLEHAFTLWGFLGGAPKDLLAERFERFQGVAHEYNKQRELAGLVPEETLRMTPIEVHAHLNDWRSLLTP